MADRLSEPKKAQIIEVDENGKSVGGNPIKCMFNPYEYTISKSNTYDQKPKNNSDVVHAEFKQSGSQNLKLSLFFDTYEQRSDVSQETEKLWKLMSVSRTDPKDAAKQKTETKKKRPPYVRFEWGVFQFTAVITEMTQKFTLFLHDGTPVRATVDVTFMQFDKGYERHQNPTSGGGPLQKVRQVVAGDRLDLIAHEEYGDADKWPEIANANKVRDLSAIQPGQKLLIPDLSASF